MSSLAWLPKEDDPDLDGTDGAHPAWWRGTDRGVDAVVQIINETLDGKRKVGTFGHPPLNDAVNRLIKMRDELNELQWMRDGLER